MTDFDGVVVTLHDFPVSVQGALSIDNDGTPCIHLNARLTREAQQKAFEHEIRHLEDNDFDSPLSIADIEG